MTAKVAARDMGSKGVDRRAVLGQALAWGAAMAFVRNAAQSGSALAAAPAEAPANTFGAGTVRDLARKLAGADYIKPAMELPEPFNKLSYDQYRDIRFKTEQSIWRGEKLDYELQLFPVGFLYDMPVEISVVDGDKARALKAY